MKKSNLSAYLFSVCALSLAGLTTNAFAGNQTSEPGFATESSAFSLANSSTAEARQQQLLQESFSNTKSERQTHYSNSHGNGMKWVRQTGCAETNAQNGRIVGTISSNMRPDAAYVAQMPNKKVALVYKNKQNANIKTNDNVVVAAQHCDM